MAEAGLVSPLGALAWAWVLALRWGVGLACGWVLVSRLGMASACRWEWRSALGLVCASAWRSAWVLRSWSGWR